MAPRRHITSRSVARDYEIEPGRRVPDNWDKHMVEPWAARRARRAADRADTRALLAEIERDARQARLDSEAGVATARRLAWARETPTGFGDRPDGR